MFKNKAKKEVIDMVKTLHSKINVLPGTCRFNYKCHNNSVHDAIEFGHEKIAMTVYIDGDWPVIHFINYNNGVYTDNTLGHWSSRYDYYLIRHIDKSEFFDVTQIFICYNKELKKRLSFLPRVFSNIEF